MNKGKLFPKAVTCQPNVILFTPAPNSSQTSYVILTEAPSLQVILARQYGSEGRFTFTSHTPGEHQICLHSNSTKFSLFAGGMLVSGPSVTPGCQPLAPGQAGDWWCCGCAMSVSDSVSPNKTGFPVNM